MTMQVVKNTVVTLDYSVTDPDGELVDAEGTACFTRTVGTMTSSR